MNSSNKSDQLLCASPHTVSK